MTGAPRFDDRIDRRTDLAAIEVARLLWRALRFLWPLRRLFLIKLLLMCGSVIPIIVAPWPFKIIIDHVLLQQPIAEGRTPLPPFIEPFARLLAGAAPLEILGATIALLAGLVLLFGAGDEGRQGAIAFLAQGEDTATQSENMVSGGWSRAGGIWGLFDLLWHIRLAQGITHLVRCRLHERLARLPMLTIDNNRIGDSLYRVMYDTAAVQALCVELTLTPAVAILAAIASLSIMEYSYGDLAPQLIWIGIVTMPLILLATLPLAAAARRASQASRASGAATANRMEESLANITAVQSLGATAREQRRFADASAESFRYFRHVVAIRVGVGFLVGIIGAAMLLYLFMLISNMIMSGLLTPGDFQVLISIYLTVAVAAGALGQVWINLQNNAAAARRVFLFFDLPLETQGGEALSDTVAGRIALERVSFEYEGAIQAIREVDLEAGPGEMLAIVGPTGSGKTTLAHLIAGYYRPSRGRVSLDGCDLVRRDPDDVRRCITYVFQEHQLFSDTLFNNIAFGKPGAGRDEVERAARLACAHTFIERLPGAYEARLGRGGSRLSTGERQRISIARGLLRDTPVLILDEPTASLDVETEARLLQSLETLRERVLVIVITHRLAIAAAATRIIFMAEGRICEEGSHSELSARPDGRYRQFLELVSAESA